MTRPRVVVVVEYYLPGFQAGGPMRSIAALIQQLGEAVDFRVITRDRDAGIGRAYPDLAAGEWMSQGHARVRYLAPHEITTRQLVATVRQAQPHVLYLNSIFAPMSVRLLAARRLGVLEGIPVLLAPRGELSRGALALKAIKKRSYLRLSRWIGLYHGIAFHASTTLERDEILDVLPGARTPLVARNPVAATVLEHRTCVKEPGAVTFVFLSRLSRKKNLHRALGFLRDLRGRVEFAIHGPVVDLADQSYWEECQALIQQLPPNVQVHYRGPVEHESVQTVFSTHHFLLFPTANENFGHVIAEALMAGCPTVISDQTPWRDLAQQGAGWDLPLDDTARWRKVLQACVDMDSGTYAQRSRAATTLARRVLSTDTAAEHLQVLRAVMTPAEGPEIAAPVAAHHQGITSD